MSGESGNESFSRDRAELFEALGHPTRIKILNALAAAPLGFSELKRELGIESSGQLQFHLGKLNGLVKSTPEGNYALTDQGRDALRTVVDRSRPENTRQAKINNRRKRIIAILAILLAVSLAVNTVMTMHSQSLNQLALSMEDVQFSHLRLYNISLIQTEGGRVWIGFDWEAYFNNPANASLNLRLDYIGINIDAPTCSNSTYGFLIWAEGTTTSWTPYGTHYNDPFTEWVRVGPHGSTKVNGTLYTGPYGTEWGDADKMIARFNCIIGEGYCIEEIIMRLTFSSDFPLVQIEKTLSLSHAQIVLLSY